MKRATGIAVIRLCLLLFVFQSCTAQSSKINGISFVASRDKATQEHLEPVKNLGANHAAVMPFGFIRALDNPKIAFNTERQWYGERRDGAKDYIELLHANKVAVMLKPQIWISHGEFTGYLRMEDEAGWKVLEDSYRSFILEYADLAQETHVSLFCIGTELEQFVVNRPDYWKALIAEIKTIYTGKITYAANWDEYKRVPFWKDMDYIGIDGYFPVCDLETPTLESAREGWQPWKLELSAFAKLQSKKILFTEWGYRSVNYAGKEPWTSDRTMTSVNLEAQVNTTRATFEELWPEEWFAGGFVWKWFIHHDRAGGLENNRFTPQNKPAEAVIKEYYAVD